MSSNCASEGVVAFDVTQRELQEEKDYQIALSLRRTDVKAAAARIALADFGEETSLGVMVRGCHCLPPTRRHLSNLEPVGCLAKSGRRDARLHTMHCLSLV